VSPPAFTISMARAHARRPLALEITMFLVLDWAPEAKAGSTADPSINALRVKPGFSFGILQDPLSPEKVTVA
jgi:hypothetical protein